VRVEAEARADVRRLAPQQMGEFAAVADLVVVRVEAADERSGGIEAGLDRAAADG